jgi:hypothetical protein
MENKKLTNTPFLDKEVPKNSLVDPCNEAERVPIDPEILKRIRFNDAEQFFLKRLVDRKDACVVAEVKEAVKESMETESKKIQENVSKALGEVLGNFQEKIFKILDSHTTMLRSMALDIRDIKTRLAKVEDDVETDQERIEKLEEARIEAEERLHKLEKIAELPKNFDARLRVVEKFTTVGWTTLRVIVIVAAIVTSLLFLVGHLHDVGWFAIR